MNEATRAALLAIVDDVGNEVMGSTYGLFGRHKVRAWLRDNPQQAERLRAKLVAAVKEGKLG